jgi:hypothetical protein
MQDWVRDTSMGRLGQPHEIASPARQVAGHSEAAKSQLPSIARTCFYYCLDKQELQRAKLQCLAAVRLWRGRRQATAASARSRLGGAP